MIGCRRSDGWAVYGKYAKDIAKNGFLLTLHDQIYRDENG